MTAEELQRLTAILRRVASMTPLVASRLLAAFTALKGSITTAELARLLPLGIPEQIAALLVNEAVWAAALRPARDQIRNGVFGAARYFQRQIPKASSEIGGVRITFDTLNPRVIDAVRELEGAVLDPMTEDIRTVVRLTIGQGFQNGDTIETIGRNLRDVIGIGPSQFEQVQNFRDALNGVNGRTVSDYTLRDRRFNLPTTPAQVEKQVAIYMKNRIAQNAATVSRSASLQSMKLGQRLSWQDAIDQEYVDAGTLMRRWHHLPGQTNPRPEHEAMDGEEVAFDQPYSNGDTYAGENDPWNCHCHDEYFIEYAQENSPSKRGSSQTEPDRSPVLVGL